MNKKKQDVEKIDDSYETPMMIKSYQKNSIKRNAKCPCGSNKKFKHCCLNKKGIL